MGIAMSSKILNQETVNRRLKFAGKLPQCYEAGQLSEFSVNNDPRFAHQLMSNIETHHSFDHCNKRQQSFVRLQRIIDKIREPIQNYSLHADGKSIARNPIASMSTAQLIQEYDLVSMLE